VQAPGRFGLSVRLLQDLLQRTPRKMSHCIQVKNRRQGRLKQGLPPRNRNVRCKAPHLIKIILAYSPKKKRADPIEDESEGGYSRTSLPARACTNVEVFLVTFLGTRTSRIIDKSGNRNLHTWQAAMAVSISSLPRQTIRR
jgi:hypothetical protein